MPLASFGDVALRGFVSTAYTLAIAVSCGGSTEKVDSSRSAGGAGGGAAAGGSNSQGGTSQGGTSQGGTSQGGASGTAGTQDAGGPDCFAPPRSRHCGEGSGFYFDQVSGTCRSYGDNACYDSPNTFRSLGDCLNTCVGARPDVSACDRDSDCAVVDAGCCGACEPVAPDSLIAVNSTRAQANDYRDPCPPIACGACPPFDELSTTRQYFLSYCSVGTCRLKDIRHSEYTRCIDSSECVLRDGANCCEGCDGRGLVALGGQLTAPLCTIDTSCPPCVSIIPPGYGAECNSGYCNVIRSVDAGAEP